ncbi:MAG TPA: recombinase family protein [Candidatus Nanopelagicales bacterium]|nr:recombinase family protein [Candidatus Nanopelagicales bacterium]
MSWKVRVRRIGGDTYRTGIVIQDLLDHGVRLFYYFTNEEVRLDGAIEKFLVAARAFAAELEREKTSQRTHEHLMTKARRGLNVGGQVFGYENVEIKEGDRRVRVEYRIHEGAGGDHTRDLPAVRGRRGAEDDRE